MSANIVMFGPPGAGKGTQAERLARTYGIPRISTGDILREAAQDGSGVGRTVKALMAVGQLVGDDLMIGIVADRLSKADAAPGFVLDGFPRTVVQARALDGMVSERGPLMVLAMQVPTDVLVARLSTRRICVGCGLNAPPNTTAHSVCPRCGGAWVSRNDDGEAVVRERLKVYERQTQPLVEFYRDRSTFYRIDGNGAPDVVFAALEAALSPVGVGRRTPEAEPMS